MFTISQQLLSFLQVCQRDAKNNCKECPENLRFATNEENLRFATNEETLRFSTNEENLRFSTNEETLRFFTYDEKNF